MSENERLKELKERLFYKNTSAAAAPYDGAISAADSFCEGYKEFLNSAKTEREAVEEALRLAKLNGFIEFHKGEQYSPGEKIYVNNRGKSLILAVIGSRNISEGLRIAAAHIDSPRLDLKQNPLYEDGGMAYFKTHYYGGIKKYQWTVIPLALHGVVIKKDGEKINIKIGENDGEPVFVISDLLPHLAAKQMGESMSQGIKGEQLNIIIGSHPLDGSEEADAIKLNIMSILNEKYGITEADFLSAELEAVPAGKSRDIGFDRSLIGSYGHDDRVCAYPSLMAILDAELPEYTSVCVLTDKEETGSDGNTGLHSSYLRYFAEDLAAASGLEGRDILSVSKCLSADVTSAFDPTFPEVYEKRNASLINHGVAICKYTGARGKAGTSDCSAEFMAYVRNMLDSEGVNWQTGELGKVDEGGGGTVAMYIANLGVETVDVGVPVLSMHAPFEVVAKMDVYMAYKGFRAFLKG